MVKRNAYAVVDLNAKHGLLMVGMLVATWSAVAGCQFPDFVAPSSATSAGQEAGGSDNSGGTSLAGFGGVTGGSSGTAGTGGGGRDATGGTAIGGTTTGGSTSMAGGTGGTPPTPPEPCGKNSLCAPAVPNGWLGPIALWQDAAGSVPSPPSCPKGYGAPNDLHAKLDAPAASCTCQCGAIGQVCDALANISVYGDLGCQTQCLAASPAACGPVAGCNGSAGTMRAAAPSPSGGSCKATVTPQKPPAQWQNDARLCSLTAAGTGACSAPEALCVPTPTPPYASQVCVFQVVAEGQTAPACPAAYPNSRTPLYSTFADTRGCSACTCGSPSGGSCSGTITLSGGNDCSGGFVYTLGSGCQSFSLSAPPAHARGDYQLKPGSCAIAKDTSATGSAKPSGNANVVCCL